MHKELTQVWAVVKCKTLRPCLVVLMYGVEQGYKCPDSVPLAGARNGQFARAHYLRIC